MFYPKPDLCPDCEGTGYTWMGEEFTLCYCMTGQLPAYDFPRITKGEIIANIGMARRNRNGKADVWVPCRRSDIGPIKHGPYDLYFRDDIIACPGYPTAPRATTPAGHSATTSPLRTPGPGDDTRNRHRCRPRTRLRGGSLRVL